MATKYSATLVGDGKIDAEALAQMKAKVKPNQRWAVYQNHALDSIDSGRLTFLKIGEGCTFETAPATAPDNADIGLGWKYIHVGFVNLETGTVE